MRGLVCVLVMIFLASTAAMNLNSTHTNAVADAPVSGSALRDYVQHGPIRINSDSELDAMASSEGWAGSGTWLSPYIIENYEIDAKGGSALFIGNTTKFFIVRYSHFYNSTSSYNYAAGAIQLYNVQHGYVYYNNISDGRYGVYIKQYSSQVENSHNEFYNLTYGTYVDLHCEYVSTSWNTYLNVRNPIEYRGVSVGTISFNKMINRVNVGIMIDGNIVQCSGIRILRNTIETGSSGEGIYLYGGVRDSRVENNTVNYSEMGIRLYSGVENTTIANNTLYHTISYGISIISSSDSTVYNNSFVYCNGATDTYDPNHVQAYNNGTNNKWYHKGHGNYWSDWTTPDDDPPFGIVDNPYTLKGDAGSEDPYPLTTPPTNIPELWSVFPAILFLLLAVLMRRK